MMLQHAMPEFGQDLLPLQLGQFDHYTLIVADARAAAEFHVSVLGFRLLRVQDVCTGTGGSAEPDMRNYVLSVPSASDVTCVITEGLTEDSIFRQYMVRYGEGVHHVGYRVDDIERAMRALVAAGVRLTTEEPVRDPLSGLRQIFLDRTPMGYFVELIERTHTTPPGNFTSHNMAGLARSMTSMLPPRTTMPATVSTLAPPSALERNGALFDLEIDYPPATVRAFLADPLNLPRWTCHRTVRWIDNQWKEVRLHGDVPLEVHQDPEASRVVFRWSLHERELAVAFRVVALNGGRSRVETVLPIVDPRRFATLSKVIPAELRLLRAELEEHSYDQIDDDRRTVREYHLEVYQRTGL